MSEFIPYYDLAKHNDSVRESIKNAHPDWGVVLLYYSAIHWINGFCIKKYSTTYDPSGHNSRDKFISKNFRELYKPLRQLESESESIRYKPPYWNEITRTTIASLEADYKKIKTAMNK